MIWANEGRYKQAGSIDINVIAPLEKPEAEVAVEPKLNLTIHQPVEESELTLTMAVYFAIVLIALAGVLKYFFL
jgi:hypothetical protein